MVQRDLPWIASAYVAEWTALVHRGTFGPTACYDRDAGSDDPNGTLNDIAYGGHDRDVLQGNSSGDRLVDSNGSWDLFYVCPAAYGGVQISRSLSPSMLNFFTGLATADGATGAATSGTTGYGELSLVYPGEAVPENAGSAYPGTAGHFNGACPPTYP